MCRIESVSIGDLTWETIWQQPGPHFTPPLIVIVVVENVVTEAP